MSAISEFFAPFARLPAHGLAALALVMLYGIQAEVRFGAKARASRAGSIDRGSSLVLSAVAAVPVFGLVLAMKTSSPSFAFLPAWFAAARMPVALAWVGVIVGAAGLGLRLWAVLTLRERYTRTLRVEEGQAVERRGPYRRIRHPGYLGSLLTLNGVAAGSGNWIVLVASLAATIAAYAYRVRVEDEMLVASLGAPYAEYRREVPALLPRVRRP